MIEVCMCMYVKPYRQEMDQILTTYTAQPSMFMHLFNYSKTFSRKIYVTFLIFIRGPSFFFFHYNRGFLGSKESFLNAINLEYTICLFILYTRMLM